jgi:hypothetical protein
MTPAECRRRGFWLKPLSERLVILSCEPICSQLQKNGWRWPTRWNGFERRYAKPGPCVCRKRRPY